MIPVTYVKDLKPSYDMDHGLVYASPARGPWNIVHVGTLVPEAHEIFVCPTSCLRGVVLTTAEMGVHDKLSTIAVGEDNILDGDMEERLHDGIVEVIETLPKRPRMAMVFTSCIHHFLAVNYQRVYRVLRKEYPDIDFTDTYMDPIMRRKIAPMPSLFRQMHRVLQPMEKHAMQANVVGSMFAFHEHSDFAAWFKSQSVDLRQLQDMETYDEFKDMASSKMNFVFHRYGVPLAKDLQIRLGQPWMMIHLGYDYDVIDRDMALACDAMGIARMADEEIKMLRKACEDKAKETLGLLGDVPIVIDYTAIDEPFGCALFLLRHGFNVEAVYTDNYLESEEILQSLQQIKPMLKVYPTVNWNMRVLDRERDGKIVALGQKAAYFNDTDYFVDIVDNAHMQGYRGIMRFLDLLADAYVNQKDMRSLIQVKGWGCAC